MAVKIIWSPLALADAEDIAKYIARDSQAYAAGMIQRIVKSVDLLSLFPSMGRHIPEIIDSNIRELIVRPYRVIYRIESDQVTIAAIIHGARMLEDALRDRVI
jgi:addiction module RelE/StbE family toxin